MVNKRIFHIQILFQPLFLYVRGRVFCMVRGIGYPFFLLVSVLLGLGRGFYMEKKRKKTHSTGLFEWVKSKKNVKKVVYAKTLLCCINFNRFAISSTISTVTALPISL